MLTTFAVLAASVSLGGSIRGIVAAPVLPKLGLPGAGLPSSVRRRILPSGWFGILGGSHALAVANREEQILAVGREGDLRAFLAALALGHLAPQHLEVFEFRRGGRWRSAWRAPAPVRRRNRPARHT